MAAERESPGGTGTPIAPGAAPSPPFPGAGATADTDLARQLTGDLPCPVCRYNLRGLSVKSQCPECGTPVRAAILYAVDPYAPVLQPFHMPRLTAAGIVLWSVAGVGAVLLTWALRASDVIFTVFEVRCPTQEISRLGWACVIASGIGGLALIRPHARIPAWVSAAAVCGVACTWALAPLYERLHLGFDVVHVRPYLQQFSESLGERSLLRLGEGTLLLAIVLLFRPITRLLAARSLIMRLGHVDRQTMPIIALAVCIAAAGDLFSVIASRVARPSEFVMMLALFPIVIGSMLFTVGVFAVARDSLRIASVIVRPPAAPGQVLEPRQPPAGERA